MENDKIIKIVNFVENSDNADLYNEETKEYLTSISKDSFIGILDLLEEAGHVEKVYRPEEYNDYIRYIIDLKKNGIYKTIIPKSDSEHIEKMQEIYEKDLIQRKNKRKVKNIRHAAKLIMATVLVTTTIGIAAKGIPSVIHFYSERDEKIEQIMEETNKVMNEAKSQGGTISPEYAHKLAVERINARNAENGISK